MIKVRKFLCHCLIRMPHSYFTSCLYNIIYSIFFLFRIQFGITHFTPLSYIIHLLQSGRPSRPIFDFPDLEILKEFRPVILQSDLQLEFATLEPLLDWACDVLCSIIAEVMCTLCAPRQEPQDVLCVFVHKNVFEDFIRVVSTRFFHHKVILFPLANRPWWRDALRAWTYPVLCQTHTRWYEHPVMWGVRTNARRLQNSINIR